MKIFTSILIVLAASLIVFNISLLDLNEPFKGNSFVALIGIAASSCAILILLIFKKSKEINDKINDNI